MTKEIFANNTAKIIPFVGAMIFEALIFSGFIPMTKRLHIPN